ncbi:MAG: hypothetical protein ACYTG0_38800 [Planctomycetota bacterium]|jgi:hypothetical protein
MIVDYDGRILAQADSGPGEKTVVAPIGVTALRAERERRIGHDMRGHLRSELYDYLGRPWLPPAAPGEHPLCGDQIRDRIRKGKQRSSPPPPDDT